MPKIFNIFLLVCAAAFCWYFYYAINLDEGSIWQDEGPLPHESGIAIPDNAQNQLENNATSTSPGIVVGKKMETDRVADAGNFTGNYEYRPDPDCVSGDCPGAWLSVEHSGQEIIFGIEANRAAPNYNMGTVYPVKLALSGNQAVYSDGDYENCQFEVSFFEDKAVVSPLKDLSDCWSACGFGHGVCIGGEYNKINGETPDFTKFGPTGIGKPVKDMTQNNENK